MTDEQLLFNAGRAAAEASALVQEAWNAGDNSLDHARACRLVALARQLSCAAGALESSARGCPHPKMGD